MRISSSTPLPVATARKAEASRTTKVVVGAAYTAGGSMGGLVLGSLGGTLLSNLSGNAAFTHYGGAVGALAGAVTGLAASSSDKPGTMVRTLGAWAGATAGTALGMLGGGLAASALTAQGASLAFAANGATTAAVAGGLVGAAVCYAGHKTAATTTLKNVASAALGGTVGWLLGGGMQAIAANGAPGLPYLVAAAPALGAITGSLVGMRLYQRPLELE